MFDNGLTNGEFKLCELSGKVLNNTLLCNKIICKAIKTIVKEW